VQLFKQAINSHVIPSIDPTTFKIKTANKSTTSALAAPSSTSSILHTPLPLIHYLQQTVPATLTFLESFNTFLKQVPISDPQLLTISHTILQTFHLTATTTAPKASSLLHSLHISTLDIIRTVFQQYPRHRIIILEDLFSVMLKLPNNKKTLRTYQVDTYEVTSKTDVDPDEMQEEDNAAAIFEDDEAGPSSTINVDSQTSHIQMVTAAVLFMVQGCVTNPQASTSLSGIHHPTTMSEFFVTQLLQRTSKKQVRQSEERSDELATAYKVTKTTHSRTSVQPPPPSPP